MEGIPQDCFHHFQQVQSKFAIHFGPVSEIFSKFGVEYGILTQLLPNPSC
jgi:hypothetical protein